MHLSGTLLRRRANAQGGPVESPGTTIRQLPSTPYSSLGQVCGLATSDSDVAAHRASRIHQDTAKGRRTFVSCALILMELAAADGALSTIVSIQNSLLVSALLRVEGQEQIARFLPDLIAGRTIGAFALTEPDAGSGATAVRSRTAHSAPRPGTGRSSRRGRHRSAAGRHAHRGMRDQLHLRPHERKAGIPSQSACLINTSITRPPSHS